MAPGIILYALSICLVLSLASAENREEDERRWNVPPELIPEEILRTSEDRANEQQARSLLIPITANINLGDTSQTLGLQLGGSQGLGLTQSTTFSQPSYNGNGPSASVSQSSSFTAGFSGITGSSSQSFSFNGQGNPNSQSSGFGQSSASSASFAQSSASSSSSSAQTVHRQPLQPTWTNISPNYEPSNDYRHPRMPTLKVDVRPNNPRPVTLQVSAWPTNRRPQQKPRVVIHRPRLDVTSIEERNNQQWSSSQASSNLQITVDNSRRPVSLISLDNGNVRWPGN